MSKRSDERRDESSQSYRPPPLFPPLVPRNGHTLEVILPGRVSDPRPGKQDVQSLEDQESMQRRWLEAHVSGPCHVTVVAGSGSGELLDREAYVRLLALIESRKFDLVLTEDLGRIVRRARALDVCELCEDHDTRLIAINNAGVDTAQPGWRDAAFFSAYFYEKENLNRSLLLKDRLRSRFLAGGALPSEIFGYIRPPGTHLDTDMRKDPSAEWVYKRWFEMLDNGASFAEVADWLNANNIPVPPHARSDTWDGHMVGRHTRNPLLKGVREWNNRKTKRRNNPGNYVSIKAPPHEKLERQVPHLAFFEAGYYDRVVGKVERRNAKFRRTQDGSDPLEGRPKKRTRFPGQHVRCGICGWSFVYGGHGRRDSLMCDGVRHWACWNTATINGPMTARAVTDQVLAEVMALPEFDTALLERVRQQVEVGLKQQNDEMAQLEQRAADLKRRIGHLNEEIETYGPSRSAFERRQERETELGEVEERIERLKAQPKRLSVVPTMDTIRVALKALLDEPAFDTPEFCRIMKTLIPDFRLYPHRLLDGGAIVQRARFDLHLTALLPVDQQLPGLDEVLVVPMSVDLYEPPGAVKHMGRIIDLRQPTDGAKPPSRKAVACQLGVSERVVVRAERLWKLMQDQSVDDPYQPLYEPPENDPKYRIHRHPRYQFRPLEA